MTRSEPTARHRSAGVWLALAAIMASQAFLFGADPAQATPSSSAVTVRASDYDADAKDAPFPDLAVTVSQTSDLIEQGITVRWTGGKQSSAPNQQTGGSNFLQLAQCWGDEAGSNGTRPDRTTCQYGGFNLPGATRWSTRTDDAATQDASYTAKGAGWWEATQTAIPFASATGSTLATIVGGKRVPTDVDLDNNEFFTKYTTNEVSWAGSGADGSGSVSFELQTVQQSPGLGCGTPVAHSSAPATGTSCWLVVIPRGASDPGAAAGTQGITQSGLFWETWKHHIAVRLDFKPTGVRCASGATERQVSGSELLSGAIGQWQPSLCHRSDGAIFSLLTGPESDAALAANGTAEAPLALTTRALSTSEVTDNLAYAPVALTGVSIGFSIDYSARAAGIGGSVPDSVRAKERQAFTTLKLTPRLLAKLLTASYTDALPPAATAPYLSGVANITRDPEFLAINDKDWSYMNISSVGVSDALTPLGRSDAAQAIWTYIMADPEAADFLNGVPDGWGMKVNPYYSTNPRVNPTKSGLVLPRDDFPKADPIEWKGLASNDYADVVNLVTWRPFTSSLDVGGYDVLRGDALRLGSWDSTSTPPKYGKGDRALVGSRAVIGVTDTAAGAQYQVAQAALLNPAGEYVTPTNASLTTAANAMSKSAQQGQVVSFDPTSSAAKAATGAYPLAMPVYAAVNPAMTGSDLRADYAGFITYAATNGQIQGTGDGQLAAGYAPIPASWRAQALTAAATIKAGRSATAGPSARTPASSGSGTSSAAGAGRVASAAPAAPVTHPSALGTAAPQAQGSKAGSLKGSTTPDDPSVGGLAAVVPTTALVGLTAAVGVPALSRLRRRPPGTG